MDTFLEKTFCEESLWVILALIAVCLASFWFNRSANRQLPPCRSGWVPWLGCAIEFGKDPLHFIQKAKDEMGPIFTLKVAGKRLTFLTAPEDMQVFFNSESLSFQDAVQQPVSKTADIPTDSFYKSHTKIHDTVKGCLSPSNLHGFRKHLQEGFTKHIKAWGAKGEGELNSLVRKSMYKGVLDNLFGDVLPIYDEEQYDIFERHFVKFDDEFEYGSQLPEMFLRDWSQSKHWLLSLFKKVVIGLEKVPENQETVLQTLVRTVNDRCASNFGLLMMWAALANAIPITFWTLAFVLDTPEVHQQIIDELRKVMQRKGPINTEITDEDLEKLPTIRNSMLEAIRLRSPGVITRKVIKEIPLKGYVIPAGDHLMLSPYWAHRNPDFFPNAEEFNPKRWETVGKDKFLEGFVAFGGGRYQCPGRWFALMEIQLYVALALHHYDLRLQDSVPNNSPLHLVGTQQPIGPCNVIFTTKNIA